MAICQAWFSSSSSYLMARDGFLRFLRGFFLFLFQMCLGFNQVHTWVGALVSKARRMIQSHKVWKEDWFSAPLGCAKECSQMPIENTLRWVIFQLWWELGLRGRAGIMEGWDKRCPLQQEMAYHIYFSGTDGDGSRWFGQTKVLKIMLRLQTVFQFFSLNLLCPDLCYCCSNF